MGKFFVQQSIPHSRRHRSIKPQLESLEHRALLAANLSTTVVLNGTTNNQIEISIDSNNKALYTLNSVSDGEISGSQNANVIAVSTVALGQSDYAFILNSSNNVYVSVVTFSALYPDGDGFSSWSRVSTLTTDGAQQIAAVTPGGNLGIFQVNGANNVYYDAYTSGAWTGWTHVSSLSTDGADLMAATSVNSEPAVFQVNGLGDLYYDSYNGSTWSGWGTAIDTGTGAHSLTATSYNSSFQTPMAVITNGLGNVYYYIQTSGTPTWSGATELGSVDAVQIDATYYYSSVKSGYEPTIEMMDSSDDMSYDAFSYSTSGAWTGWTANTSGGSPITGVTAIAASPVGNPTSSNPNNWGYAWT
jgi:hypothetical protein